MFPAHAGMNRFSFLAASLPANVPRTRGDEPSKEEDAPYKLECSPHTRG